MNLPGKRLLLGTAVAAAALGVGGIAYAAGDEPSPEQGYVTIEEGATTPSPGTEPGTGTQQSERDCPEKDGTGQAQPDQGQNEQGQNDPQGQA